MGMKRWNHPPGTLRAVVAVFGPQIVVCDPCRRFAPMTVPDGNLDRAFDPCPFRCSRCGRRGALRDAKNPPAGYVAE